VLQLPLIWKVPEVTNPGGITDSLVSTVDYPKTILNLLGIKERHHPPDMQGYDITPILKNHETRIRDCCFIENDEEVGPLKSRLRHLITEDYKLTVYESVPGYGDIYDRKNDPHEMNNLWYDKDLQEKRFELVDKLLHENLKVQTHYPKRVAGS